MVGHSFMCRAMRGLAPSGVGHDLGHTDTHTNKEPRAGVQLVVKKNINKSSIIYTVLRVWRSIAVKRLQFLRLLLRDHSSYMIIISPVFEQGIEKGETHVSPS